MDAHICRAAHRKFDLGEDVFLDHVANRPWTIVGLREDAQGVQTLGLMPAWDIWIDTGKTVVVGTANAPCVSINAGFQSLEDTRVAA